MMEVLGKDFLASNPSFLRTNCVTLGELHNISHLAFLIRPQGVLKILIYWVIIESRPNNVYEAIRQRLGPEHTLNKGQPSRISEN